MDLIYTTYIKRPPPPKSGSIHINLPHESSTTCSVSLSNTLAFTSTTDFEHFDSSPVPSPKILHHVYIVDPNTPWDVYCLTSRTAEVNLLVWDQVSGTHLIVGDTDGVLEIYHMENQVLSAWKCLAKREFPKETYLSAKSIQTGRKTYLNNEKKDSCLYTEKFLFSKTPGGVLAHNILGWVLITATGLAILIVLNAEQKPCISAKPLGAQRSRLRHADITTLKDGRLLAAVSSGEHDFPIRTFSLFVEEDEGEYSLRVEHYTGLSVHVHKGEDECRGIVDIRFVKDCDCDAILVATKHPAGGRVEMWELRQVHHTPHRFFTGNSEAPVKRLSLPIWNYVETFSGPAAQVVALRTPSTSLQDGRGAPCYVIAAYADGSIQCLLRDSLQQIESVDLPRSGNVFDEPAAKMARTSISICDVAFTGTGNAFVVVDSYGQLYLYRLSPISDPGGPHTVPYIVTMMEYCLVSGRDWWDVEICAKTNMIETIVEKLTENYQKQNASIQKYYASRFSSLRTTLLRLSPGSQYRGSDSASLYMLSTVTSAFDSLIRPSEVTNQEQLNPMDKLSLILGQAKKDETDIDKVLLAMQAIQKEYMVDAGGLNALHQLIQWIASLALHLMARLPEFKQHAVGPGYDLIGDKKVLHTLREMLVLIRLWGSHRPSCLPTFNKTNEALDVIAKLFNLITRFKDNPSEEALQEECLQLSGSVIIPGISVTSSARGVAPAAVNSNTPACFDFAEDPVVIGREASDAGQVVDCMRYIFMGRKPYAVKQCTRCQGKTMAGKKALSFERCSCAGLWKAQD